MVDYVPHRILLTGGAGFIMSHLTDKLLNDFPACSVIVFDVMDYCASERNLADAFATKRCKLIKGDIRNFEFVSYLLASERIDTVIHGCAISHVDLSFGNSLKFTEVNTYGSHVLLESIRVYNTSAKETEGVKRCIIVSTDETYGNALLQCDEKSNLFPTNPYAASKAAMEQMCHAYIKSYNLPLIITRGNNVYATRQFPEKMVPKFIHLLMQCRPLSIHGSGTQKRSLMHVDDACAAFSLILSKGVTHEVYNMESHEELTVLQVAQKLLKAFDIPEDKWDYYIKCGPDRLFNDQRYFIDGQKLRNLGWRETRTFDESIPSIIQWYKDNKEYWPNTQSALVAHPTLDSYNVK